MIKRELTQGRCRYCKEAYRWPAPPLLREAYCPRCGRPLDRTSYQFSGKWREEMPAIVGSEIVKRRETKLYDGIRVDLEGPS